MQDRRARALPLQLNPKRSMPLCSAKSIVSDRQRIVYSLLTVMFVFTGGSNTSAEDVIRYGPASGRGEARVKGTVLEYTGRELRVRLPGGREQQLDGGKVIEVTTTWGPAVQRGDAEFAKGNYLQASRAYRDGLPAEMRIWARRRILAQVVWCLRYQGQTRAAIETFLAIYESDPTTQFLPAIPLSWSTSQPDPALQHYAEDLLDDSSPAARLVGASWLLTSGSRGKALRELRAIDDTDARITFLAQAQLWRILIGRVTADETIPWQQRIDLMPSEIRAGPYFLLGKALAEAGEPQDAALAFMRVPILYPPERLLAASALFAAGQQLEHLQQIPAANTLYREIVSDHAESPLADRARQRLAALQSVE